MRDVDVDGLAVHGQGVSDRPAEDPIDRAARRRPVLDREPPQPALAQLAPAEDFFNSGAQLYISNNIPAALERVETGLKTYPDDEKLKKLEELLKQQQQQNQQQQNQQNQKNQSQQSKNDQQKNQQNQQNQSSPQKNQEQQPQPDQQKQDEQKQKEEQQKKQGQQPKQQSADQQKADQEKEQPEKGSPLKPGQMTPEEAKKLLDAQKADEQLLQMKPEGKPQDNSRPIKDW